MKKFFSVLCALAIVFSASATPVKRAGMAKFVKENAKEMKMLKSVKAEKTVEVAKTQNAAFAKAPASKNYKLAKAKAAEAIDVTVGSWDIQDWGEDGELYLYSQDNTIAFYFDLYYGEGAEDLIPGKEYTVADLYVSPASGEQYGAIFYNGDWHYGLKQLSVVKTIDEKNLVHFAGSVIDSLDAAYTFHYDEPEFVPTGEVVEHAFKNIATLSYFSYYGQWSVRAQDNQYAFRMDLNEKSSESPVGEYNSADGDFDLPYTSFTVYNATGDSAWEYKAVEATASIKESGDSTLIAIDFLCENGVRYKATAFIADPKPEQQVDFIATDLEVDASYASWGLVWLDASNDLGSISLTIYPDEEAEDITGEYTISNDPDANASGTIQTAEGTFDLFSGSFTVAKGEAGYAVTGTVLAKNNVEYKLNLTYVKPEPTRQAELTVSGLELSYNFEAATPWWQLYGYNADSTVMVSISPLSSDKFAGNYKGEDLDPSYTYIVTDITYDEYGDIDTYNYFKLIDADLTVTYNEADSTMNITGKYIGRNLNNRLDIPEITVNLTGKLPTPEVSDMTFQFSEDEEIGITVTPSNDEDAWDWYIASEALFESYGADGIAEAVYGSYGNTYATTGEYTFAWDGDEIAYYCAEGGVYYLVVWGAGEKNVTTPAASYKFEVEGTGNQYDAEEDFIVDFASYTVDDQYVADYGVLFIEAETAAAEYINLELWLPEGATALAAGVYPVSEEEYVPQTVTATSVDQYIYGSFAGTLDADGYINIPFWFFAEGTVTVNADASIVVDVINTKGAAIKCNLKPEEQAVENVNAAVNAAKRIKNGQLVIEVNGVRYNATGAIVK